MNIMQRSKGILIVLEGMDGSGKSTQSRRLVELLGTLVPPDTIVATKQPGGTELGLKIRGLLQHPMHPMAELLLLMADRVQHLHEVVRPSLEAGKIVVSDRWDLSSLAYQGSKEKLGNTAVIEALHQMAVPDVEVDLLVFLIPSLSVAMERIRARGASKDKFEGKELLEEVHTHYQDLATALSYRSDKVLVIDADQSEDEVHQEIQKRVLALVK